MEEEENKEKVQQEIRKKLHLTAASDSISLKLPHRGSPTAAMCRSSGLLFPPFTPPPLANGRQTNKAEWVKCYLLGVGEALE